MGVGPKPIEGHLVELGFDASLMTDTDRRAIAEAVHDAVVRRNGTIFRRSTGEFRRIDPTLTAVRLVPLNRPKLKRDL